MPDIQTNNYNHDECFNDGDAGLLIPSAFTFTGTPSIFTIVPCISGSVIPLGKACKWAAWGTNIDINVRNQMQSQSMAYVNILMDWNQDGQWRDPPFAGGATVPEHILVNFPSV